MEETYNEVDRGLPGTFAPDALLPSQYFDSLRGRGRSGEWNLLVAILEDGLNVYRKHAAAETAQNRELFEEAEAWVEDRDTSRFLAFESVCDILGLDPDYIRRGLHAWKLRARKDAVEQPEPLPVIEELEPTRRAG
jgi:hypothetical protein